MNVQVKKSHGHDAPCVLKNGPDGISLKMGSLRVHVQPEDRWAEGEATKGTKPADCPLGPKKEGRDALARKKNPARLSDVLLGGRYEQRPSHRPVNVKMRNGVGETDRIRTAEYLQL